MISEGYLGDNQGAGEIALKPIPEKVLEQRTRVKKTAAETIGKTGTKQILFGDLHVHTTFSMDAFLMSLPVSMGEGAHPPADACDYARFCSALDFWSITDHAESITPRTWLDTKNLIRQCNAVTNPDDPDVVAFLGYEWTQAESFNPDIHYGHKNVIFRDIQEKDVPERPIYAICEIGDYLNPVLFQRLFLPLYDFKNRKIYFDHNRFTTSLTSVRECPEGVNTRDLPPDCREGAEDPASLFSKLDEGGFESIVIPHGNTWGNYTPAGVKWDKQLKGPMHDPDRQIMFEIFSGHGNSEEYRDWRAVEFSPGGEPECPEETDQYTPACRRAGQIIKERCLAVGENEAECRKRENEAQQNFVNTFFGLSTVPATTLEDWLDSGQCRDCFLPAFDYRPGGSAQYALAISNFDDPDNIRRFRFGFVASSDNHTARPGTGYKEVDRHENTEARGVRNKNLLDIMTLSKESFPYSQPVSPEDRDKRLGFKHAERLTSFFLTGGLIATHADGRDRNSIWESFKRREVYGTSGDRILLWFDLLNGPGDSENRQVMPMGSEVKTKENPRFRVRAVGAFKQKPGCPEFSKNTLSNERLHSLCRNECYNPSDQRKLITRIEVVRIRPQVVKNEPVKDLIEDVWLSHSCKPDPDGCSFEFEDAGFQTAARDTVYYVRAIQEHSDMINAGLMRCEYDEEGKCINTKPCYGDFRTSYEDDCLGKGEERAWSSPIFIDYNGLP